MFLAEWTENKGTKGRKILIAPILSTPTCWYKHRRSEVRKPGLELHLPLLSLTSGTQPFTVALLSVCARAPKSEKEKGIVPVVAEAWHYHPRKLAHQVSCCSSWLWEASSSRAERTQLSEMVAGIPHWPLADHRAGIQLPPGPLALATEGLCKAGGSLQEGAVGTSAIWPPLLSVTAAPPSLRQLPSGTLSRAGCASLQK